MFNTILSIIVMNIIETGDSFYLTSNSIRSIIIVINIIKTGYIIKTGVLLYNRKNLISKIKFVRETIFMFLLLVPRIVYYFNRTAAEVICPLLGLYLLLFSYASLFNL